MSSYQTHNYSEPRESIRVYRCLDNHWHFFRHKNTKTTPWYRQIAPSDASKFPDSFGPVYAKGCADEPYTVDLSYESGFYSLRDSHGELQTCPDTDKRGWCIRQLWREEELSQTPWLRPVRTALPTYGQSSTSSVSASSRLRPVGTVLPTYQQSSSSSASSSSRRPWEGDL